MERLDLAIGTVVWIYLAAQMISIARQVRQLKPRK